LRKKKERRRRRSEVEAEVRRRRGVTEAVDKNSLYYYEYSINMIYIKL